MGIIVGMAKSHLNLNGAKRQKSELDYLKLVYFVKSKDEIDKGYLLVPDESIAETNIVKTIEQHWKSKYEVIDEVQVLTLKREELTPSDFDDLLKEKAKNALLETNDNSIAVLGKTFLEEKLKEKIEDLYNSEKIEVVERKMYGIDWDYCGEIKDS